MQDNENRFSMLNMIGEERRYITFWICLWYTIVIPFAL